MSRKKRICTWIKCPNCKFSQQTLEDKETICVNYECQIKIDVFKNIVQIVNGGGGR